MIASITKSRKQFRPFEFLVEKSIALTAFTSIAIIALIFVFVFREAVPLFIEKQESAVTSEAIGASETYGSEMADPAPEAVGESETYGSEMVDPTAITADAANSESTAERETNADIADFKNLSSSSWQPVSLNPQYGLWPLIAGSLKVAFLAMLFATPIAIGAALYSAMFAPKWVRETIKPVIEILAGIPSVVVGFFALMIIATIFQNIFGLEYRLNAMVGGIALSLAIIPIVFTLTEDALTAVPRSLVDASTALGAHPFETALFVVLPAATPGIYAAVILGMGRAIGETMIALMATGNAALVSLIPVEPVRTMAATIGAEMAEVVFGDVHYRVLFLIGSILFAASFVLNIVAEVWVQKYVMRRFRGA